MSFLLFPWFTGHQCLGSYLERLNIKQVDCAAGHQSLLSPWHCICCWNNSAVMTALDPKKSLCTLSVLFQVSKSSFKSSHGFKGTSKIERVQVFVLILENKSLGKCNPLWINYFRLAAGNARSSKSNTRIFIILTHSTSFIIPSNFGHWGTFLILVKKGVILFKTLRRMICIRFFSACRLLEVQYGC